jgi:hypothetical protein
MMNQPNSAYPDLPPNTIVPDPVDQKDIFIQYFNRLYEDIAFAMNQRDFTYYQIQISDVAQNIPFLPTFGAFMVCVSGVDSTQPTGIWTLCKADTSAAGTMGTTNPLCSQPGTGAWLGNFLTITSTATNFQIVHDRANTVANFNIRVVGTQ